MSAIVRRAALFVLGCVCVSASRAHASEDAGAHGPRYVVDATALGDLRYRVRIRATANATQVQTIEVRNGVDLTNAQHLRIETREGQTELWILGGQSAQGNWYKVWRLDPSDGQFHWLRTTSPSR